MTRYRTWLVSSAVAAVAVYALMWIGYALQWNWLVVIDTRSLDVSYRHGIAHPGWVTAWNVFCTVLGPTVFRLLALVMIFVALARRSLRVALFLVISVELSGLVTEIAKHVADRPRPGTALVTAPSSSFPSGHALGVMVGVLALLTIVLPVVERRLRVWLIAACAVIVALIGIGRVVLNVHHASDVIAGWALGYAYFVICLLLVPPSRPVRVADETPGAPGIAR